MEQYFRLFGKKMRDRVTGAAGIATSICFDLYGCVQVVLTPRATEDGTTPDGRWFDAKRLEVIDESPVMERPTFELVPGPAHKSLPPSGPR